MTKSYTVGLIAAPEFAENISHRLVEKLPKSLKKYISNSIDWEMEMEVDSMTGAAETVEEIFKEAAIYKQDKQWDYVVCLTDLRSEEHTSELQSRGHLVCRLLLEKKKKNK